jgi:hypothetical protein
MFNRPVASEACFRRADSRSHNGHSACASPSASATSCSRVVSAEIECAGARASTARASSPRETAEPRADPAVAAGELVDQRDAVAGEVRLHRRTHPHSASEAGQTSSPTAARPIPRPCSTANSTGPGGSNARWIRFAVGSARARYNWAAACLPPTMRRTL